MFGKSATQLLYRRGPAAELDAGRGGDGGDQPGRGHRDEIDPPHRLSLLGDPVGQFQGGAGLADPARAAQRHQRPGGGRRGQRRQHLMASDEWGGPRRQ